MDYAEIFLNNGDGTFRYHTGLSPGSRPHSIFAGDFDLDGNIDMAFANAWSSDVSIFMGHGNGYFDLQASYPTGPYTQSIDGADFNQDGFCDLVVAIEDSSAICVLLNQHDGTFAVQPKLIEPRFATSGVACAFIDDDNNIDVITANLSGNNISLYLGNGDGTFQQPIHYSAGTWPCTIHCTDLNNDQKGDVIVGNYGGSNISILFNNGDGTLQQAQNYGVGEWTCAIDGGDINNDGYNDLVVANQNSNYISILKNLTPQLNIIHGNDANSPSIHAHSQNYPNPFNASTTIKYDLPKTAEMTLSVYDILGRKVETINAGRQSGGQHSIFWNAKDVSSGIYFYKIQAGDFSETRRCLLLK